MPLELPDVAASVQNLPGLICVNASIAHSLKSLERNILTFCGMIDAARLLRALRCPRREQAQIGHQIGRNNDLKSDRPVPCSPAPCNANAGAPRYGGAAHPRQSA